MKNRLEFILCSGFLFLGGLVMLIIFNRHLFLYGIGVLFCWMGALGLLVNYGSNLLPWFKENFFNLTEEETKEDNHEND